MKKLIYTIAGSLIITCGYAQTDSTGQKGSSTDYNSTTDTISTTKSQDRDINSRTRDSLSLNKSHDNDLNSRTYPASTQSSVMKENQKVTKDYSDGVIMKADGIIMQDGKMCMVKDNIVTPLNQEITLNNGTRVMVDGSYSTKDGKKKTLQEGEHLDMMGKINPKE